MSEELKKEAFTEEELKEIRRRKRALKKKRLAKKKLREQTRMRALLEDEENEVPAETPEARQERLYAKAQKKLRFAPHMYHEEDRADMYRQAAELFGELAGYGEADKLRDECLRDAEKHRKLYIEETYALANEQLARAKTMTDCRKIRKKLDAIADYRDVTAQQAACARMEEQLVKSQRNKKFFIYFLTGVVLLAVLIVIIYVEGIL